MSRSRRSEPEHASDAFTEVIDDFDVLMIHHGGRWAPAEVTVGGVIHRANSLRRQRRRRAECIRLYYGIDSEKGR